MKKQLHKIDLNMSLYFFIRNIFFAHTQKKLMEAWLSGKSVIPPHVVKQNMLKKYCHLFNLKVLVETGTYFGDMVESMKHEVDKIYSVELSRKLFEKASNRFSADEHIEIINGDGGEKLPQIMQQLDQPALFWLDGHYSAGFTAKGESDTSILRELVAIFEAPNLDHVVIIDDARCFGSDAGYPTIDEIKKYVLSQRPDAQILIENDSIIITPHGEHLN